jgi:type IV pilus assembly protein PilA
MKTGAHRRAGGFTLIEMMVVVAIVGILSALAVSSYHSAMIRAKVSEGLNLAQPFRTAIVEHFSVHGEFPADSAEAGVIAEEDFESTYIDWIRVKFTAGETRIQISFNAEIPELSGKRILLVPDATTGTAVTWICKRPVQQYEIEYRYLPPACRNPYN